MCFLSLNHKLTGKIKSHFSIDYIVVNLRNGRNINLRIESRIESQLVLKFPHEIQRKNFLCISRSRAPLEAPLTSGYPFFATLSRRAGALRLTASIR